MIDAQGAMDWLAEARQYIVVDIGQISAAARRRLDAAAGRGEIAKWRGHWFPVAGANHGIGPLKTCYGPASIAPARATERT